MNRSPDPAIVVELQHWTEPPTGEVPRVLGGGRPDDDFDSWSTVTGQGPRYRAGDSDWSDGDWGAGDAFRDETAGTGLDVGALAGADVGEDEWAPPPRPGSRAARRGRGARRRDGGRDDPSGVGSLEGAPAPEYESYHEGYADGYTDGPHDQQGVDLMPRVVTGVVLAVVALVAFAAGRSGAVFLATLIVGFAAFELYNAFQHAGYHPATVVGLLGALAIVPMAADSGVQFQAFPLAIFLVVGFTFLWYVFEVVHARPTVNIGLTLLPFGWIGIFGGFAGLMLAADPGGTGILGGVVICAVGADIAAFFVGRSMGRTPLLPRISPNKTVEGVVGGAVAAIILGALVGSSLHPWADKGLGAGLVLGILVAVLAPLGDLVASLIKRDLGLKDFGAFLPGHGGILDRFDAILFCLPAAYYWAYHLFT